jgi:putative SOS response-associated peptidase YedK
MNDPQEADSNEVTEFDVDRVVQPMRWGLIPSWHRGDASSIEYKMNNARSDGLLSKASFKKPLELGRRCVVLADG